MLLAIAGQAYLSAVRPLQPRAASGSILPLASFGGLLQAARPCECNFGSRYSWVGYSAEFRLVRCGPFRNVLEDDLLHFLSSVRDHDGIGQLEK